MAFEVDGAAVDFDGAFDDGEAEAGAFGLLAATVEALEGVGEVFGTDADAVVGDGDEALVLRPASGDVHAEARTGVFFEGVFDEIGKDLIPVEAITAEEAAVRGEVEGDDGLADFDEGGEVLDGIVHAAADEEGFGLEGFFESFQAGEGEHVVDDAHHATGVLFHDIETAAEGGGVFDHAAFQRLDVTVDEGERGA